MRMLKKALGVLCALLILLTGCTVNTNNSVLTINNRQISKNEFMLYLFETTQDFKYIGGNDIWETDFDGQSAEQVVVERTISTIKTVILSVQKAARYDVRLNDEDKARAVEKGDSEWQIMTDEQKQAIGITKEELYAIMQDSLMYAKVYEAVTKDFKSNPADFEEYLTTHMDSYMDQYTKYSLSSILVEDDVTAKIVMQKAKEGQDFNALFMQYDTDKNELANAGGVMETFKGNLDTAFGIDFTLEEGEISQPLKTPEGYFIIRVNSKEPPTQQEFYNIAEADYIAICKRQIFDAELAQWTADAVIEINDETLNRIEMIK